MIWHKPNIPADFTMSQCEFAWTNFNDNAKLFSYPSTRNKGEDHFHPTEKPLALYSWQLSLFAKAGYKILDTHLGSQNSRKAAYDAGLDFMGFEIDPEYYRKGNASFDAYAAQQSLYHLNQPGGEAEQTTFFEQEAP